MNIIYDAKEEVIGWLNSAGIDAELSPNTIAGNMVVLEAGSPYVEQGETFTESTIRFDLVCIGPSIDREDCEERLDQLISNVIGVVQANNCPIEVVSQPGDLPYGQAIYFAATVTMTASIEIQKEVI